MDLFSSCFVGSNNISSSSEVSRDVGLSSIPLDQISDLREPWLQPMLQIPNGSNIRDICQFVGRRKKPNELDTVFPCCVIKTAQTVIFRWHRHGLFLSKLKPPFLTRTGHF